MTIEQYIKFVLRFLKENKVYFNFLNNAREYLLDKNKLRAYLNIDCNNCIEAFSKILYKLGTMERFIDYCFIWEYTREGHDFWEDIHKKFCDEYDREVGK